MSATTVDHLPRVIAERLERTLGRDDSAFAALQHHLDEARRELTPRPRLVTAASLRVGLDPSSGRRRQP